MVAKLEKGKNCKVFWMIVRWLDDLQLVTFPNLFFLVDVIY